MSKNTTAQYGPTFLEMNIQIHRKSMFSFEMRSLAACAPPCPWGSHCPQTTAEEPYQWCNPESPLALGPGQMNTVGRRGVTKSKQQHREGNSQRDKKNSTTCKLYGKVTFNSNEHNRASYSVLDKRCWGHCLQNYPLKRNNFSRKRGHSGIWCISNAL